MYYYEDFTNNIGNSKKTWKGISQLLNKQETKQKSIFLSEKGLHTDQKGLLTDRKGLLTDQKGLLTDQKGLLTDQKGLLTDRTEVANTFNKYFVNVAESLIKNNHE